MTELLLRNSLFTDWIIISIFFINLSAILDAGYWMLDNESKTERSESALSRIEYRETSIIDVRRKMSQLVDKYQLRTG